MNWVTDDAGDLIHLLHIESIQLHELDTDVQDAPKETDTHEVLAVSPRQDSYRLATGSKEECEILRNELKRRLVP